MKEFEITTGKDTQVGIKTIIAGVEGVGKTTLASQFPKPVFIDAEGSASHFDVAKLPKPVCFQMLIDEIKFISTQGYKTVVIDSIDYVEQLQLDELLEQEHKNSISAFGFGEGFRISDQRMNDFMNFLDQTLIQKGINVVLVAHVKPVDFEDLIAGAKYKRYAMKLGYKTGARTEAIFKEWADMMLFCTFKTTIVNAGDSFDKSKVRGAGGKDRAMYTERGATFDAKNRFGLPAELPLSFEPLKPIFEGRS